MLASRFQFTIMLCLDDGRLGPACNDSFQCRFCLHATDAEGCRLQRKNARLDRLQMLPDTVRPLLSRIRPPIPRIRNSNCAAASTLTEISYCIHLPHVFIANDFATFRGRGAFPFRRITNVNETPIISVILASIPRPISPLIIDKLFAHLPSSLSSPQTRRRFIFPLHPASALLWYSTSQLSPL